MNSTVGRSDEDRGQSPFSPLLCIFLLLGTVMLVKFGAALQSLHLVY